MDIRLFYYTLIVLLTVIFAGAIVFSTYIISRKKTYLIASLICVVYFFDVALVFRTSLENYNKQLNQGLVEVYAITSPTESVFYGAILIGGLWLLTAELVKIPKNLSYIVTTIFVLCSTATYFLINNNEQREFWFFTMRTIGIITLPIFVLFFYLIKANKIEKLLIRKYYILYLGIAIFAIGTLCWNIYNILILDGVIKFFNEVYILPERNFIENILFVFIATYSALRGINILRMHFNTPPKDLNDIQRTFITEESAIYANNYKLSPREKEVLILLIQNYSNQQIANELFINLTTVKVHVHNILKKTNSQNRNEVITNFWNTL